MAAGDDHERRHVTLYGKPECLLCDEARALLEACAAEPDRYVSFDLDEGDIRRDPDLFARYRYRIPVITIDGAVVAEGNLHDRDGAGALAHALTYPVGEKNHES